jgi:hypothetical protein
MRSGRAMVAQTNSPYAMHTARERCPPRAGTRPARPPPVAAAATLEAGGTPIGPYDMLIAAQALRRGATLVTANVKEFSRVRGLAWQDWSAAA